MSQSAVQLKSWDDKTSEEKFRTMGSWFLGPRGENYELLKGKLTDIVEQVRQGRLQYFPEDPDFITGEMITSQDFQDGVKATEEQLNFILEGLGRHSVPFFSPRYAGHMSFDVSMPAVLGYTSAMLYNQNNVTPEASPFTSYIEWRVGQEMCQVLGYNSALNPDPNNPIVGWGHIVCGGSIANLESMWVARNLKYYPLSLKNAMKPGAPLEFASDTFTTTLCNGIPKNFFSCTPWELLNLTPTEVIELPVRLCDQFGMSDTVLSRILEPYSIQTVGKQQLDLDFGITKPPQYLISRVNHYSWPKGAAITGIGRENMIELPVDDDARLNIKYLREELEKHLAEEQSLYATVAIVGTTEHGSVDPVAEMLQLRKEMQFKGLSFMVHADAAWGGYFASKAVDPLPYQRLPTPEYAFSIPLSSHTNRQLWSLRFVDSITIDPHKSGYIPYPGGGICYRDGRHRFLTTWTGPYLSVEEGNDLGMGIYGVEGSKPGAAPVAVWLSHNSLTFPGYADLLGVAMLTGLKMYANWVTMTLDTQPLVVTAFNRLPSERSGSSEQEVYDERVRIRDTIVNRPNYELENDPDAMALVRRLGSDLMINAFACNFRIGDKVNTDVVEASFLNRRLYQRLSITTMDDDINLKPIVIMATEFSQAKYGEVLHSFKKRMGLAGDEDLYALSNVSMSPWPTAGQFLQTIIDEFRRVAEEEIKTCLVRVVVKPSIHGFVIQGTDQLFFTYVGSLNISNYRRQVIVSAKLDDATMSKFNEKRANKPSSVFTFHTRPDLSEAGILINLLEQKTWVGDIYEGFPDDYGTSSISVPVLPNVSVLDVNVVLDRSIHRYDIGSTYPERMPFYLFGTPTETHIDHLLFGSPNIQLTASNVELALDPPVSNLLGKTLVLETQREYLMHPFTSKHLPSFFAPGKKFQVGIYDQFDATGDPVSKGTLILPSDAGKLFVDFEFLNRDAATDIYIIPKDATQTSVNDIARQIVELFKNKHITWNDNVVEAIYRLCPAAREYTVLLGYPDISSPSGDLAVLSRFLGKSGTGPEENVRVLEKSLALTKKAL